MSAANGRSRWRRWAVLGGALGAVLVAALAPTARWASRSSNACTGSCHDPSTTHVATPGHDALACQDCHAVRGGVALRLSLRQVFGSRGGPEHGTLAATTCARCHDARDARWVKIAQTQGHRQHAGAAQVDCLSCHAKTVHRQESSARACLRCHDDARLHRPGSLDEGDAPRCLACHNFGAPPQDQVDHAGLTIEACGACHAPGATKGPGVTPGTPIRPEDLHGGLDCKQCHQPHQSLPSERPCRSCHQVQLLSGRPNLPPEHLECLKCHVQHKPVAQAGSQCVRCHEQAKARTGGAKSQTTALRHDECASCHLPHTWAAAPNDCVTCHAKQATLVSQKSPERHQRCINCHEVHGNPPSAATCAPCHKENARKMSTSAAPPKHQDCTSCHNPHAPKAAAPQTCAECHKQQLHEIVSLGPADHVKAGCARCHTLHGDARATTKVCASCHKTQGTRVARLTNLPKHQQCASCHLAHRFSFDPRTPSCAVTCHQEITPTSGTHEGPCTKCHAPHSAPTVAREKCLGCHEKIHLKVPEKAPEHAKCNSCHKPHTPAKTAQAKCTGCHEEKAKVAAVWPARSAHRDTCHECHSPHDVKATVKCAECHEKEATAATGGKHQCKQCHAPHQPPATDKKGWWNRCVGCHEKQVAASNSHNQCQACHKPHTFAPPACTSCHADEAGKGQHLTKEHQQCTKCHDAHSGSTPTRAQCLACHKAQAEHEPKAPVCYGCHTFKQ